MQNFEEKPHDGNIKDDLRAVLNCYVNERGDNLHDARKENVLTLQRLITNTDSRPVLMQVVKKYLMSLKMPLSGYKLYLGRRSKSMLRDKLNEILQYHCQASIISRLRDEIKAEKKAASVLREAHQTHMLSISRHHARQIEAMQKQINGLQKNISTLITAVKDGQPISDLIAQPKRDDIVGLDQTEVICQLQNENKALHAKLKAISSEKVLFLEDTKNNSEGGPNP